MASLESNEGTGKLVVVAVVVLVVEGKLFNDEKFGVGRPNGGNAPNVGIDGKPNGRAQGRLLKVEARSSCCFFVIVSLLLLMVVVITDQKKK